MANLVTPLHIENMLKDTSFEDRDIPDYITNMHIPLSADAEMSFECNINTRLLGEMIGAERFQLGNLACATVELKSPYQAQVKRHKKKRINKKWAKRYGYKTKFRTVEMTDAQLVQKENEFEIIGRQINNFIY